MLLLFLAALERMPLGAADIKSMAVTLHPSGLCLRVLCPALYATS
jgi:hypothetical protein